MIDHLVLPVTTLTLARSRLTALGFTVAPDARHPFGTGNCCVLFADRNYLEPITIVDRNAADAAAADGLFFVRRVKRFTERQGEGLAMVAMATDDAASRHAVFHAAGFGAGELFQFKRSAALADGTEREIGVILAYADDPGAPDATFFACQHLDADWLYQPSLLQHANTARGVAAVSAVAEAPASFAAILSAAAGAPPQAGEREIVAGDGRQIVTIMTPDAFGDRYGLAAPDPRRGLLFAAVEIGVADLDKAVGYAGPTSMRVGDRIVIPPSPGLGVVFAFRSISDD